MLLLSKASITFLASLSQFHSAITTLNLDDETELLNLMCLTQVIETCFKKMQCWDLKS